jgi:hypothetical protein
MHVLLAHVSCTRALAERVDHYTSYAALPLNATLHDYYGSQTTGTVNPAPAEVTMTALLTDADGNVVR